MAILDLGSRFDQFIKQQIERGRFETEADVIRAGLHLLEMEDLSRGQRRGALEQEIRDAFDDPSPGRPADDVFDSLEERFAAERRLKA